MRQTSKVDGTKIAQAAKDLNVTSVTIRRYIQEFNIETTADENGIKVLPDQAMSELQEIRRLKEDGLTNPKVMEFLEDFRKQKPAEKEGKAVKGKKKAEPVKSRQREERVEEDVEEEPPAKVERKKATARRLPKQEQEAEPEEAAQPEAEAAPAEDLEGEGEGEGEGAGDDGKSKHSLTCQTCSKIFEHMNPRLRDCLECYRAKRKERRRGGGADRHKNVIQHPLAQQAASKSALGAERPELADRPERGERPERADRPERGERPERAERPERGERLERPVRAERQERISAPARERIELPAHQQPVVFNVAPPRTQVRNYRKAIEETRTITGSLKRRLERPDLPEGERRWLEQIYAYQLILHQGWRHLAEYKAATASQGRGGGGSHAQATEE